MALFLGSSGSGVLASKGATELLEFLRNQANGHLATATSGGDEDPLQQLSRLLGEEIDFERASVAGLTASLDDLDRATFADELATAYRRSDAICAAYFSRRRSVAALHELAGLAKDRLISAAAALAAGLLRLDAGLSPSDRFAILAAGSSGRREQTFRSGSCYFLIHEGSDDATRDYFIRLKFQILALLKECGQIVAPDPDVPGDHLWTGTLSAWKQYAEEAGTGLPSAGSRPAIHLAGFFHTTDEEAVPHRLEQLIDLRAVTGVPELLTRGMELSQGLVAECRHTPTGRALARQATALPLPLGMFGGYRVERGGEYRGAFNLDQLVIAPLVSTLRWLALEAGVAGTGTVERIKGLLAARALDVDLSERLLQAYQLFIRLKVLFELASGGRAVAYVYPDQLSESDATGLRSGLEAVHTIQRLLFVKLAEEG